MCSGEAWGVLAPVGGPIVQVASVHRRHRNCMATTALGWPPRLAAGWAPAAAIPVMGALVPTLRVAVGFVGGLLVDASPQAAQVQVGIAIQELASTQLLQSWEGHMPPSAMLSLRAKGAFAPPIARSAELPEPTVASTATRGLRVSGDAVPLWAPPLGWWGIDFLGCLGNHLVQGRAQGGYRTLRPLWQRPHI